MPLEIGFLAAYGIAPTVLHEAVANARAIGVPVDVHLLKSGIVDEVTFYRALAMELGLPFTAAPRPSRLSRYPDSILAGIAPLEGFEGFVVAPSGPAVSQFLRHRHIAPRGLVVTAPTRLRHAVMRIWQRRVAELGANALPNARPELSIRDGLGTGHIVGLALLSLVLSYGAVRAPAMTIAALGTGLSPLFFAAVVLRLATVLLGHPPEPRRSIRREDDAALPIYTVIVPLYRERRIATRLVTALSRLDYPSAKLDIKFVLEADDQETPAALAAIAMPGFIEVIVAPAGNPRTKPRALNIALPLARGRYVVIYDAEDVPEPGQLRQAARAFATAPPDVACLQARLTIDNTDDTWLTRLFTIEYAILFDVFNPGLAEIGSPIALGGTSNHFRIDILRRVHGWDAWNVTEDADLGIRLARWGYRVHDLPSSTLEEAPATLRTWMNQRTRWMKGFMQTCISHSRAPRAVLSELGPWQCLGAAILTYGTVLSALVFPIFTGLFLLTWRDEAGLATIVSGSNLLRAWSGTLFAMGLAAIFLPALMALKRRRLWRLLPWTALLPIYYLLVSVAAWRAIWEVMHVPFHWNKTSHGLAKTSRSGLLQKHHARAADTTSLNTAAP
ncbi:glycosyltransferase [Microvirga puerhi]|uniref:Glycosyltransferase n=1 Tax=Microvirga puerhi TaxID=2876078 RepID=A0ABS7VSR1_9HYPH|nr:glycosyltransferase [Microvirga puerhi]MBZ6078591.1 glycosyltransferase [Microvirga puerhi]